ncbi:uncharacterized protein SCHCODRAFT_02635895 [Schizophyllum commune H4-8]|nr:uncharacterized protein SCHCODRAFT_02635895 [Schizophyllum commune H4-8]KAI5888160.1 hypothetical protein SCHCODRAFT_02635895 [Schizophyllum commune H4-8]
MRLPQELVDAIVAHVKRGIDLITLLCASRTVFFFQVSRSLRHVFVHLATDDSYRLLMDLLKDHPSAPSEIRLLEISLESYRESNPDWSALPALLDACTGIRVLRICVGHYGEWMQQFPPTHRHALYLRMQLPTLEELHFDWTSFDAGAINELRALSRPPALRHISARRLRAAPAARDSLGLVVFFERLLGRDNALAVESLKCDRESVAAGMLLFRAREGRQMRVLDLTVDTSPADEGTPGDVKPQTLLMANPQLEHFVLRIEHWSLPTMVDLSGNKALRTLTIDFPRWRESREAGYVVGVLDSISEAGRRNLERFEFIGAGRAANEPDHGYFWCTIDAALSRLEGLKAVNVRLTPPPREKGLAYDEEWEKAQVTAAVESSMRETYGRGILEVTSE